MTKKRGKNARKRGRPAKQGAAGSGAIQKSAKKFSAGVLALQDKYAPLPLVWFMQPLREKMGKAVRPPTANTRRIQRTIEMNFPEESFSLLMAPFESGSVNGLVRLETGEGQVLQPTRTTAAFKEFAYKLSKPSQLDTLWNMQEWDMPKGKTAWRRGHGAAKLHLSAAAGERGQRSSVLAMVCGNISIRLRAPAMKRAIPTLRMVFAVLSMDECANIIWPTTYELRTKAALRKMAKAHLQAMLEDDAYPTMPTHQLTLQAAGSDSVWSSELQPRLRQEASNMASTLAVRPADL